MARVRKRQRQGFRCTDSDLLLIEKASKILRVSVSDFVRSAAVDRAKRVVPKDFIKQNQKMEAFLEAFHQELAQRGLISSPSKR